MRIMITALVGACALVAQPPFGGGFGPPGFGPPGGAERKIVKDHDRDKDGRLDKAERLSAREALAKDPPRGFGRGPRFGGNAEPPQPGPRVKPADVKTYGAESLYDPKVLRTIFLEFENPDWEKELAAFNNTDVEVPAKMTVDGKAYKEVGVHFRGASSFMMVGEGRKRSLNISLDFSDKDQRLLGYRTLNLNNAFGDPTFLRPVLYSLIARQYLPAPQANYMHVVINGESWGVYVNTQQFNADFLNDWFKTTKGNRWKAPGSPGGRAGFRYLGDDVEEYKRLYQIKSKDNPKAWKDLIALTKVLTETPLENLEAALKPIFDTDGALRFLAVEKALINSDGYWIRASDYSLYQDAKGVFHIIPHDMNEGMRPPEMMGGGRGFRGPGPGGPPPGGFGPPPGGGAFVPPGPPPGGFPQRPPADAKLDPFAGADDTNKVLLNRLVQVPALRTRYLGYLRDIATNWLNWTKLQPIARDYQSLIAATVKADTRKLFSSEEFTHAVTEETEERGPFPGAPARKSMSLKSFIEQRRDYLLTHPDIKAAPLPK